MSDIARGMLYYLEVLVTDNQGVPVTGLSIDYKVIRSSDNFELDNGSLIEVGNGVYQESYLFDTNGQYRVLYFPPIPYSAEIETVNVSETSFGSISGKLDRILGLVHENFRIFNAVYNRNNDLISGIIKIYPTASDVDTDTNPTAIYEVKATYGAGKLNRVVIGYQSKRIL